MEGYSFEVRTALALLAYPRSCLGKLMRAGFTRQDLAREHLRLASAPSRAQVWAGPGRHWPLEPLSELVFPHVHLLAGSSRDPICGVLSVIVFSGISATSVPLPPTRSLALALTPPGAPQAKLPLPSSAPCLVKLSSLQESAAQPHTLFSALHTGMLTWWRASLFLLHWGFFKDREVYFSVSSILCRVVREQVLPQYHPSMGASTGPQGSGNRWPLVSLACFIHFSKRNLECC